MLCALSLRLFGSVLVSLVELLFFGGALGLLRVRECVRLCLPVRLFIVNMSTNRSLKTLHYSLIPLVSVIYH